MKSYYPVELGALVPLRSAHRVLGLAGTELAKVLGRLGNYIVEEFECDPTKRFACRGLFVRTSQCGDVVYLVKSI